MKDSRWVVIDTETDGLHDPIHVVELSGQLMEGWEAVGEPFRMLLNHDVPIPSEAVAIHGYTQEYLKEHGQEPVQVYELFREYAGEHPLVAHNLSYDWNRCLEPEWARLGIPRIGRRGFCSMMLARRLTCEPSNYRLDTLKHCFQLTQSRGHQAMNDVLSVVELFRKIYRPRLELAGIDTFESVADFAKRTPVAKCLDTIRAAREAKAKHVVVLKDEWYFHEPNRTACGPFTALQTCQSQGSLTYRVWREGMDDWVESCECREFLELCHSPPPAARPDKRWDSPKTMSELVGICRGLIADDKITTAEVRFFSSWLEDAGFISEWPASEFAQTIERIVEDGVISKQEKEGLKALLQRVTSDDTELVTA